MSSWNKVTSWTKAVYIQNGRRSSAFFVKFTSGVREGIQVTPSPSKIGGDSAKRNMPLRVYMRVCALFN